MVDYNLIEERLNEEAKKILLLIKKDYYSYMSAEKKQILDELIDGQIVIVNQGISHFNDNTLAHGGRALNDGRIHFYPDARNFSTEEAIEVCKKLLPHECFHYFIQPDKLRTDNELEEEMASFYTEGLIEKESRIFCERHQDEITFEKANYGYNINFVNKIQNQMGASSYGVIFSEDDYIKSIARYISEYKETLKQRKHNLDTITEIAKSFPPDLQSKVSSKMKKMILQDGNADEVIQRLKDFEFVPESSIKKLESTDELEL